MERYRVEPRRGPLIRTSRTVLRWGYVSDGWLHQDVSILGTAAGSTHVSLAEAVDRLIRGPAGIR